MIREIMGGVVAMAAALAVQAVGVAVIVAIWLLTR